MLHQDDEEADDSNVILCMVRLVDQTCIHENVYESAEVKPLNLESMPETQALGPSAIDLEELRMVLEDVREDRQAKAA